MVLYSHLTHLQFTAQLDKDRLRTSYLKRRKKRASEEILPIIKRCLGIKYQNRDFTVFYDPDYEGEAEITRALEIEELYEL